MFSRCLSTASSCKHGCRLLHIPRHWGSAILNCVRVRVRLIVSHLLNSFTFYITSPTSWNSSMLFCGFSVRYSVSFCSFLEVFVSYLLFLGKINFLIFINFGDAPGWFSLSKLISSRERLKPFQISDLWQCDWKPRQADRVCTLFIFLFILV